MPTPDRIRGVLHLQLIENGTVAFVFMPGHMGVGSTTNKAKATVDELKLNGQVEQEIDADAEMVAKLFP